MPENIDALNIAVATHIANTLKNLFFLPIIKSIIVKLPFRNFLFLS